MNLKKKKFKVPDLKLQQKPILKITYFHLTKFNCKKRKLKGEGGGVEGQKYKIQNTREDKRKKNFFFDGAKPLINSKSINI